MMRAGEGGVDSCFCLVCVRGLTIAAALSPDGPSSAKGDWQKERRPVG